MADDAKLQENYEGIGGFLSGLIDAASRGARSTMDAAQEDFDLIKQGRAPRQAIKAGGQVIGAMGNPAVNPTIPALQYTRKVFDPQTGWQTINKVYPGGDWFSIFARMGGFGDPIARLLAAFERGQSDLSPGLKK